MLTQNAQYNIDLLYDIIKLMNIIFVVLIALAYFATLQQQLVWHPTLTDTISPMQALGNSIFSSAEQAVELSIGLIGVMTFFLGLMKVAEACGLLRTLAKILQPIMVKLFPDIPPDHPAQGAIIMNVSANLLGLGNAATPFGIKAMQELDSLNPNKGTATNAMVLFLAMNTASITLIPTKIIALRSAAGSQYPADIISTTLFASVCATLMAIVASKSLQRFFNPSPTPLAVGEIGPVLELGRHGDRPLPLPEKAWRAYLPLIAFFAMIPLILIYGRFISPWVVPTLTLSVLVLGISKKIPVYEIFTEGAKEGFWVAVKIIPYLVSVLAAMGMLKTSGVLTMITSSLGQITTQLGMPAEALPMALMRPLSGGAAMGIMTSVINDPAIGPDSYLGYLVSTLMGSTDTTFYIIALYFGSIQIKHIRHTVPAALLADLAGIIASVFIVNQFFG